MKVLLAEGFKELVLEKPVEKITIKEITDRAGVIRVTFYNHFQDKYELLEWICREEVVNPTRSLLKNGMSREAVIFIFKALLQNREFYRRVAHTQGQNSFESIISQLISGVTEEYLNSAGFKKSGKYSWLTAGWVADFYAMNLTYIIMGWIEKGMIVPPEEMADIYANISGHSLLDIPGRV